MIFSRNKFVGVFSRSWLLWRALAIGAVVVGSLDTQSAWAQGYGMGGMMPYVPRTNRAKTNPYSNPTSTKNAGPQRFQGTATIVGIGERGLEVVDANGSNWRLAPEKNCVIEVTGTADVSFLKPDMLVRFTSQFDKKGNATAPVNELELISPQAAMTTIKQEVAGKKDPAAMVNNTVIGHIKSIKSNQLTVQTTNGTYAAELGSNPSIKVNVSDFRWAQAGDKVDAVGYYSQPGLAYAQQMRVTLSSTLSDAPKKKPAAKGANGSAANK